MWVFLTQTQPGMNVLTRSGALLGFEETRGAFSRKAAEPCPAVSQALGPPSSLAYAGLWSRQVSHQNRAREVSPVLPESFFPSCLGNPSFIFIFTHNSGKHKTSRFRKQQLKSSQRYYLRN